jgi:TolB-like protein/Tfp pilus assembly protein PilF
LQEFGKSPLAEPRIREQLARILGSRQFSTARRLSAFLDFVVAATLAGEEVKESLVGVGVYGREPSYNPKTDGIVRAEASRLRAKLREYYDDSGRDDAVLIELPKGSYTPVFRLRQPTPSAEQPVPMRRTAAVVMAGIVLASAGIWIAARSSAPVIAVMPIRNLGPDRTLDTLADVLTSEVTRSLLASRSWSVIGKAPAFDSASDSPPVKLLRELGAEVVLTGRLQSQARPGARLTLELISVSDWRLLWRQTWDRTVAGLADSQKVLAQTAVLAMTRKYARGAASPAAEPYLTARENWSAPTVAGVQQSLALFQKAMRADPGYAPAFAGYADALANLSDDLPDIDTSDKVAAARAAARRALALDPENAEAHAVLGRLYLYKDWSFAAAVDELHRAVRLDPARLGPNLSYAQALSIAGDLHGAQRVLDEAGARLPVLADLLQQKGSVFFLARKWQMVEEIGRQLIALEPENASGHWLVGLSLERRGQVRQAIAQFQQGLKAAARDDLRTLCALAHAYGVAGDSARAIQTMRRYLPSDDPPLTRFTLCYCAALVHTSLKRPDAAFAWLEKARLVKDSSFPYFPLDQRFDALRSDPRYDVLARSLRHR